MMKTSMLRKSVILSTFTLMLLLLSATAFASGSEPPEPLPAGLSSDNHFKWGIYERYFDVYIPENIKGPVPLVLDMHGLTGTKEKARESHGFYDLAVEEGFIVAWPQGIARSWNGQWCCPPAGTLNVDDVGFLTEMVSWISDRANVDISRVYATGHSNGGAVTNQLGLRSADVFAAIAPVSFQLTELATVFRRPTRPMPMLEIHGNTDKTVRYPEGIGFGSVEDGFDDWARFNGCVGESEITWDNGNGAFRKAYQYCDNNIKVEFLVLNAGHNDIYSGEADNVDVTRIIWDFLSQWTMP